MKTPTPRLMAAVLAASTLALAGGAQAAARFYEDEGFRGRSVVVERADGDFRSEAFNDRASSVIVSGRPYQLCEHADFGGRCIVLQPGEYRSLWRLGFDDRISSARMLRAGARTDDPSYRPANANGDYRRRSGERLYRADVVAVRAVGGTPEQRCWIEREELPRDRRDAVPGAVIGAVVGGILGHQVGGGSGRDLATIAGVVGGAAVGANVGRGDAETRDVRRCETVSSQWRTQFYDVTYRFQGREHHVQLAQPPGETILVNRDGEPRA